MANSEMNYIELLNVVRRKDFGDISVTVIDNGSSETFLVGGRAYGPFTINGWTTFATITGEDFCPSKTIRGTASGGGNGQAFSIEIGTDGKIYAYASSSITVNSLYISVIG